MQRRVDLLAEQRLRVVVDAHAPFLEHDLALGGDVAVRKIEIGHAVGFQRHRHGKLVFGDLLVEVRCNHGS